MQTDWQNLSDPIFHYAERRPDAPALIQGDVTLTYRELANRIAKGSVMMRDLGVKPGEIAAVAMASSIGHVVTSFALMRAGAIPLDLPAKPPPGAVASPLKLFNIKRVFRQGKVAGGPPEVTFHNIDQSYMEQMRQKTGDHRVVRDADELHNFSMTSGSTGAPRGVMTSRRQWQARFESALNLFPDVLTPERPPTLLVIGGIGFSAFYFFLSNQLFIGGPAVLMTENHQEKFLAEKINSFDDAATLITPPAARKLLDLAPSDAPLFPKMRALFIGASPLFPDEKLEVAKKLSPNFREIYGSAACGFISTLPPSEIQIHPETVGRPTPGLEVNVVDGKGNLLPPGKVGHFRFRGPTISMGFFGNSGTSPDRPEGFRDGWYYPGDLGSIDEGGYLSVRGRISDLIYRGGVEIMPLELEQIIAGHDSIADVAVVGASSKDKAVKDQKVIGFVVPRGEPQKGPLAQYCRANIPKEKFPDRVFFVRELPKNANGKIDRPRLKAIAERGPPQQKAPDAPEAESKAS